MRTPDYLAVARAAHSPSSRGCRRLWSAVLSTCLCGVRPQPTRHCPSEEFLRGYIELLRRPGGRIAWAAAFLARLVLGMAIVAMVLLVRRSGYDYAVAGAAAALLSVGMGMGAPIWGRIIDRRGPVRILQILGACHGLAMTGVGVLAARTWPVSWIYLAAVVAGFSFPPVSAVARVGWRRFYGLALRDRAYALDGVTTEVGFVLGPVLAAVAIETVAPWAGVVLAGWLMIVATLTFSSTALVRQISGTHKTVRGGALRVPAVRVLMAMFALVGMAFGSVDILVPAVAESLRIPHLTGVLLGAFAFGSGVGGFIYGGRSWPSTRFNRLQAMTIVMTVAFASLTFVLHNAWLFGLVAASAGLVIAPIMVIVLGLVDDIAPVSVVTESLALVNTAIVLGASAGSAVAGQMVERFGLESTVLVATGALASAGVTVALRRSTLSAQRPTEVSESVPAG